MCDALILSNDVEITWSSVAHTQYLRCAEHDETFRRKIYVFARKLCELFVRPFGSQFSVCRIVSECDFASDRCTRFARYDRRSPSVEHSVFVWFRFSRLTLMTIDGGYLADASLSLLIRAIQFELIFFFSFISRPKRNRFFRFSEAYREDVLSKTKRGSQSNCYEFATKTPQSHRSDTNFSHRIASNSTKRTESRRGPVSRKIKMIFLSAAGAKHSEIYKNRKQNRTKVQRKRANNCIYTKKYIKYGYIRFRWFLLWNVNAETQQCTTTMNFGRFVFDAKCFCSFNCFRISIVLFSKS